MHLHALFMDIIRGISAQKFIVNINVNEWISAYVVGEEFVVDIGTYGF